MPLFMDTHKKVDGLTAQAVADAHKRDVEVQKKHGSRFLKYWFNESNGRVYCLAEAPNREAVVSTHREAHGLLPDEIVEVKEGT